MKTLESESNRKSYEQVCPMATALDLVGDRWTILVLRELLGGPARFQELKSGLPGIAANLLTERLRRMESDGIIRRLGTGGRGLYALTESGAGIRTAIEELGMWGARMGRVSPAVHQRSVRAIAMALQAVLVRAGDSLPGQPYVIELDVGGDPVEVVLGPRPAVTVRTSLQPDARIAVSSADLSALLMGEADAHQIFSDSSGDPAATRHLVLALGGSV